MSLCMHTASIPVFTRALTNLAALLLKAEQHATEKKIAPSVLLQSRLYPDMFPLTRQVQIACDIAKGGAARLAGVEIPSFPDTETSFAELQARIQTTLTFLNSLTPTQINGSEDKAITLKVGGNEVHFTGEPYLLNFVLPNIFFHTSIAYAILRENGVAVGKMDYLGAL